MKKAILISSICLLSSFAFACPHAKANKSAGYACSNCGKSHSCSGEKGKTCSCGKNHGAKKASIKKDS